MLADLLVSQLSRPATTRERFRLPFSKEDTIRVLLAGVKAEVERRDKTFIMSEALMTLTLSGVILVMKSDYQRLSDFFGGCFWVTRR